MFNVSICIVVICNFAIFNFSVRNPGLQDWPKVIFPIETPQNSSKFWKFRPWFATRIPQNPGNSGFSLRPELLKILEILALVCGQNFSKVLNFWPWFATRISKDPEHFQVFDKFWSQTKARIFRIFRNSGRKPKPECSGLLRNSGCKPRTTFAGF